MTTKELSQGMLDIHTRMKKALGEDFDGIISPVKRKIENRMQKDGTKVMEATTDLLDEVDKSEKDASGIATALLMTVGIQIIIEQP